MKSKNFCYPILVITLFLSSAESLYAQNINACANICSTADTNSCWQCQQQVKQQQIQSQQQQILQQQQQNQARMQELMQSQQSTNCVPTGGGGFNCRTSSGMYR